MLQKLNERIQGVIAWTIIGVVAFTFTLFGVDSYLQAHHASAVEAEVDGVPISKQAFELQYRRMRQAQAASGVTDGAEQVLKRQILDDMIATQVNLRAAQRYGFGLDMAQANQAIIQIPQFQEEGKFSPDRYQQTLNNALFTPQSFREEVRQGMLLNQQRFTFMGTAFALPKELEQFVKLYGQTRHYRYVQIPSRAFFSKTKVSDEEIKAYYEANLKSFRSPEIVRLEVVKLSMQQIRDTLKPTDAVLKADYEQNQNNYMAPAKWSLRHVLFKQPASVTKAAQQENSAEAEVFYTALQAAPETFEARAKALLLEKPGLIETGNLPLIVAGESSLDSELVQLTTPGELLGPIKTDAGYEVFQLIAYEPAQVRSFASVKADVKVHWLAAQAQTMYAEQLEALTDQSYQTPDSLQEVSKNLSLSLEQTEYFSRDGGKTPVTASPEVIKAAFSQDVLVLRNNSAPIQLDEDTVIVFRIYEYQKPTQKPLAVVASEIKNKLRHQKAQAKAVELGETLLDLHQSTRLDSTPFLINHLTWQTVTQATRDSSLAPPAVNALAFTLSDVKKRAGIALPGNSGYVVVELKEIIDGKMSLLDKEQLASVAQQISANYGAIDYDLYVNQLIDQAKVIRH